MVHPLSISPDLPSHPTQARQWLAAQSERNLWVWLARHSGWTGTGTLMLSFAQAFERLLQRAPGPVFPRARQLYLRKYPLEEEAQPFRTFLLEEEIQEAAGGALRVRAVAFALVHWQEPRIELPDCATYLQQRWRLRPDDLALVEGEEWFREGGAYASFSTRAVYERAAPTTTLVNPSADRAAPAADPGSSR